MSAQELSFETVQTMKKNDYKKLFLKKSLWKKAEAVLIMVDFKLDGKKNFVAIPYRKIKDATDAYKLNKNDKKHPMKKTALCGFKLSDDENTGVFELKKGGLSAEKLLAEGETPFAAIPFAIQVTGKSDDAEEFSKEPEPKDEAAVITPEVNTDAVAAAKKVAELLKSISTDVTTVKGTLTANIKANKCTEADAKLVQGLLDKIKQLMNVYAGAPVQVQRDSRLAPQYEQICVNVQPQMEKLLERLEWSLAPETHTKDQTFGKYLTDIRSKLKKYLAEIEEIEHKITKQPSPNPPEGKELLDMLNGK